MNFDPVIIPSELFDLSHVEQLSIGGRGGKERDLARVLLPTAKRASSPLYDYEVYDGNARYLVEIKKQHNDQWFDVGKYFELSEQDRDIALIFVNHTGGKVDTIAAIHLGVLVHFLMSHAEYKRYGWSPEVLRIAHELKKPDQCPELQFKAKLKVRNFVHNHGEMFQIIFRG